MIVFATPGSGVIAGGWEYIWAAYGVTWLFFAGYSLSLFLRTSDEETTS